MITSTLYIAERLNLWFAKQPLELLRNLPSNTTSQFPCKYIKDLTNGVNMAQFTIPHITSQKIEELLKHMLSHKATGSDGLVARILKIAAPAIALPLT